MLNQDALTKAIIGLLLDEQIAVNSYDKVIEKTTDPYVRQQLEECRRSHVMRCDIFRDEVEDLGHSDMEVDDLFSDAVNTRRYWSSLDAAKTADMCKPIVIRCEKQGTSEYRSKLDALDVDVRQLVEYDILPEQERTEAITANLKHETW